MVAEQTGARVVKLPIGADRLPDLTQLPALLNDKTRLLALGQMSNVTGGCRIWHRQSPWRMPPART